MSTWTLRTAVCCQQMFYVRYGAKRPWPDPTSCCLPVSQGVHRWEALERRRDGSSRGASAAAATGRGPVGRPHGCPCCAGQRTRGWRSRLLWQELACPHGGGCQASLGHLCTPQVSRQHPRPGDLFARSCSGVTSHRRAGRPRAPTAGGGCPHVLPAIPACPHCPRQLLPQWAASRNAAAAQRGDAQRRRVCRITTITPARFLLFLFFSVGQVVNIKAKVNRAFNSSMEVGVPPPAITPTPAPIPPRPSSPLRPVPGAKYPNPPAVPSFHPSCQPLPAGSGWGGGYSVGCGSPGSGAGSQGCCALSQVGIQVSYEDLCSGKHCSICKAYATFVAQGPSGSKVSGGRRPRGSRSTPA